MKRYLIYGWLLLAVACTGKVKQPAAEVQAATELYTCPMHPQIIEDHPGTCPICGMDLVLKTVKGDNSDTIALNVLLQPTNQYIVSAVPLVQLHQSEEPVEIEALGAITYDTRYEGAIAADVTGRIEKLYVRYRFQEIHKGQKIMDIYSPQLQTAQQELLFLLEHDPDNAGFIKAAREKLYLLGMSAQQVRQVEQTRKPIFAVTVYSKYSGHIHESGGMMAPEQGNMKDVSLITEALSLREGMYVNKGETVFSVYDPSRAWVVLNIFAGQAAMVHQGDHVRVVAETAPDKDFRGTIDFIEPFYRRDSKTLTARVYFDNSTLQLPVGSQVKAVVFAGDRSGWWLPEEAVLSLGLHKVVFLKEGNAFRAHEIQTGLVNNHLVQVLDGLQQTDSVAANAQYLVDSESFIKLSS